MIFSTFRDRFGIPGVISVIALVFAMFGGAYAASSSDDSASVRENLAGKRGPRGPRGKVGPTGPQGAAGIAGPAGPQGPKGDPGTTGKDGVDGVDGTFSTEPLPANESLTGAWGTSGGEGATADDISLVAISFPISTDPAPLALLQLEPGMSAGYELHDEAIGVYPENNFPEAQEAWEAACPGSAASPEAAPGFLCIYKDRETGTVATPIGEATLFEAANEFGITVPFRMNSNAALRGSWAVTAE